MGETFNDNGIVFPDNLCRFNDLLLRFEELSYAKHTSILADCYYNYPLERSGCDRE
jgi:hypothetical protein